MFHISVFIFSFFVTQFIFVFSENLDIQFLVEDISRFTTIDDITISNYYLSIFLGVVNTTIFYKFKVLIKNIDKNLNIFFMYSILNLFTTLFFFYFLRIYTASRFYLILSLFLFPALLYINSIILKKSKYLEYLLITAITLLGIFMVINQEQNLGELENLESSSSRPLNYYPDLEMDLVGGETNVLDYYPTLEVIISDYKEYKNEFRGKFTFEQDYELKKYSMCCYWLEYRRSGGKSVGYLENYKDNLIYLHGSGFLSYTAKKELLNGSFKFNIIESNFHEIINNKYIFEKDLNFEYGWADWWESTRDVIIVNDRIYVSFVNEKSENCVNVEILSGEFNYEYINFEYFFTNEDCVMRTDYPLYNGMVAGGKLENLDNKNILLSTGDFRNWEKAQDDKSYLGKVISIEIDTSMYNIISKGHRNPQGLSLTKNKRYLIETEHGPVGGDEINLIEVNESQNFGWPISSYGKHWFPENYEMKGGIAPLHGSHIDYGMREPLFYQYVGFFGGIGISDVEINHYKDTDSFFVATLNGAQIFDIDVNIEENKMTSFKRYKINERIRDMVYDPDNAVYYLVLEDGPSIGVFSKTK